MKTILLLVAAVLSSIGLDAQCTTLGQTPSTAFPVCGVTSFIQTTVPLCSSHELTVPGCPNINVTYADLNPFWYKFTCYQAGTLGFLITPNDLGDDYDWQLFDITGHVPDDVFTDPSLFVAGNWAGTYGLTGASATGTGNIQCASNPVDNIPTFSQMPVLKVGHNYLLLISHFTQSQSGYQLSFGGGTASITDTTQPRLQSVSVSCDATTLYIKLHKKMKCSSLAPDGSDFTVSSALSSVISASAFSCTSGFDMDSVVLTLSNPLPPGNYSLIAQKGIDNNVLLDNCGTEVPVGDNVSFAILPLQPTPMDSLVAIGCSPGLLQLVFSKPMRCNSIAAEGTDFRVTGPTPVVVSSAYGQCNSNNTTNTIYVQLAAPIVSGGLYQIQLVNGTDGNTIIDECGQMTPAGSALNFVTKDTVSANFSYQILYGCRYDTVLYSHDGRNGVNQWTWSFADTTSSTLQNPAHIYSKFGIKNERLIVSNGVCSDTASIAVNLDNELKSDFEVSDILCPEDLAIFKNSSIGAIISWNWDFGDGTGDAQQTPANHGYPATVQEKIYQVSLIVRNALGCSDTSKHQIRKLRSCYIAVPNAFTPNGDGLNDFLYPLNAYKAINLEFRVFNRYGQLVFETRDWTKKWDGTINGKPQDTGTYVWTLEYMEMDSGKKFFLKGSSVLVR